MDQYSEHKEFLHIKQKDKTIQQKKKDLIRQLTGEKTQTTNKYEMILNLTSQENANLTKKISFHCHQIVKKNVIIWHYQHGEEGKQQKLSDSACERTSEHNYIGKIQIDLSRKMRGVQSNSTLGNSLEKFPYMFKSRRLVQGAPHKNVHPISGHKSQNLETTQKAIKR